MYTGGFLIRSIVQIPRQFVSHEKANEIENFYKTIETQAVKRSMGQCVENIRKFASWRDRDLKVVAAWLDSQQ